MNGIAQLNDWQHDELTRIIRSLQEELESGNYTILSTDKAQNEMGLSIELGEKKLNCSLKISIT